MTAKKPKKAKRDNPGESREGRDPKTGHFLPGNDGFGGGRPRRPDLYNLASARAAKQGYDLEEALWGVIQRMITEAQSGDAQAAKLVFDRLSSIDPVEINVNTQGMTLTERQQRIRKILGMPETNGEVPK